MFAAFRYIFSESTSPVVMKPYRDIKTNVFKIFWCKLSLTCTKLYVLPNISRKS